jgi:hypothetical protein
MKRAATGILLALLTCCEKQSVTVYITASASMEGASVLVDGRVVARMRRAPTDPKQQHYSDGSLAVINVAPGTHEIRVVLREHVWAYTKKYLLGGEDYIGMPIRNTTQ